MLHLDADINDYFNCLKCLKSPTPVKKEDGTIGYLYDNKLPLGLADTMTAQQCARMMYCCASFNSVEDMIASVKRIAEQVPGFEAFMQFYDDLKNNYDFAYKVYSTFGKALMNKKETRVINGELTLTTTNNAANTIDALWFDYTNTFRSNVLNIDAQLTSENITSTKEKVRFLRTIRNQKYITVGSVEYNKQFSEILKEVTDIAIPMLGNINLSVIKSYVLKEGSDPLTVIQSLLNELKTLNNRVRESKESFFKKQYEASVIYQYNDEIRKNPSYNPNDLKDVRSVWNESYISNKVQSELMSFAKMFAPYTAVVTSLNSRNAAGKIASDVLNNSMISNLKKVLTNVLNDPNNENSPIRNYGKFKFRGKQYRFSNILVETRDKKGNIVNYGLFRMENGQYVPTSYFDKMLEFSLFNGTQNSDTGESMLYSGMRYNDYVQTALINYFKTKTINMDVDTATFFFRTPSDAPKNFMMKHPIYRIYGPTGSLLKIENKKELDETLKQFSDKIKVLKVTDPFVKQYKSLSGDFMQLDTFLNITIGDKTPLKIANLSHFKAIKGVAHNGVLTCSVEYDGHIYNVLLEGYYDGSTKTLNDYSVVGIVDNGILFDDLRDAAEDNYKRLLEEGKLLLHNGERVKRTLNREHQIFRQFQKAAYQEMQDIATAITKIFKTVNGQVVFDEKGNPVFNEQFGDGSDIERYLYANYHHKTTTYVDSDGTEHKEKGLIQTKWERIVDAVDENGVAIEWHYEPTRHKILSGNVFRSDKFEFNGRNYMNEIFSDSYAQVADNTIHPFYGGSDSYLHVDQYGNCRLTAEQYKIIDNKIEEFLRDYISENLKSLSDSMDTITDIINVPGASTVDLVVEFVLNYRLAFMNFNDLFEGDSKFYKSHQDFLKRAKESQGSGVPYGIADFTKPMYGQNKMLLDNSVLNSPAEQELLSKLHDCKQYSTFVGVTIKNTIRQDENTKTVLVEQLTNLFIKEGLSESDAKAKATKMMSGYANTKVNDAQSYITFEEWIRRIAARGQYYKYKPLIEKILDESKPLSASDLEEFVQVQKNFYYDQYFNEELGVHAPRQIKNAEFVLVPRFIKGTQLEDVYNLMIENGVDQLNTEETSKAGKCNILTLWDNDGNLTEANIADFKKNVGRSKEIFDYNYLYTQQETPQHMNNYNKASLQIMKKILDNIDSSSPLSKEKVEFMHIYAENIRESFATLMSDLNVPLKSDGSLDLDENGNIKGLDFSVFLGRLEEEMVRLGVNSNMLDYVTLTDLNVESALNENGFGMQTKMPSFINSTKTRLENVAQALFNNFVTRQKLKGFHAAQITNVGWKQSENSKTNVRYAKELKYHPDGKGYIEVMLPASFLGLDRNAKAYNDLRTMLREERGVTDEQEIENLIDAQMLKDLQEAGLDTVLGYRIPTEGKQSMAVMKVVGFINDGAGSTIVVPDAWVAQTGSDFDIDSVYGIQYNTTTTKDGKLQKVQYITEPTEKDYLSYIYKKNKKIARLKGEITEAAFNEFQKSAKELGLPTFEEFKQLDAIGRNSREARGNRMLEIMVKILENSIEENLSQSQFSDIISSLNKVMSGDLKRQRENRTCYDFLDQAKYQEDAMAGASLKARSVNRDTFLLVCNSVKPYLSSKLTVAYDANQYSFKELQKRFDVKKKDGSWLGLVTESNGKIIVQHKMFGWSNDNHNVENSLLTVYSSETTAHILDAIKEGAVPNVNEYTFDVYKLFPDLGINYDTAIGFMLQPVMTSVVNTYYSTKSVYQKSYVNPINENIRILAERILPLNPNKKYSVKQLEEMLDNHIEQNGYKDMFPIVLDATLLKNRIDGLIDNADVFDYLVLKQFKELQSIGTKVNSLLSLCKPDKFGAKQSIFQTLKVFEDIQRELNNDSPVFTSIDLADMDYDVKGVSFLEKIYPGISALSKGTIMEGVNKYIQNPNNDSAYPSLHAFLKYSSATSLKISQLLFDTQHPNFIEAVRDIKGVMSGINPLLTEEVYNDYERYILSNIYRSSKFLKNGLKYDLEEGRLVYDDFNNNPKLENAERRRIYGYDKTNGITYETIVTEEDSEGNPINVKRGISFTVEDINNPTEEELANFCKLSPAQKVAWVKNNFSDSLVCKYIKANLVNQKNRGSEKYGAQTLEFNENGVDIEKVYNEFNKTFRNTNPLLALTAADIIKYAFVVEGFNYKYTTVNKVIDNDVLTEDFGAYGTGVISDIRGDLNTFIEHSTTEQRAELVENYVRSHSNMKGISRSWVSKRDSDAYIKKHSFGVLSINLDGPSEDFAIKKGIIYYDQVYDSFSQRIVRVPMPNTYVKLNFGKGVNTLYKIHALSPHQFILTPLNQLQEHENAEWSVNSDNNKFKSRAFYEELLDRIRNTSDAITLSVAEYNDILSELNKTVENATAPRYAKEANSNENVDFDINSKEAGFLKRQIEQHFEEEYELSSLIIEAPFLKNYVKHGSVVKVVNGNMYLITKLDTSRYSKYLRDVTKAISEADAPMADKINEFRNRAINAGLEGHGKLTNIYSVDIVTTQNDDVMSSSIEEQIADIDRKIRRDSNNLFEPNSDTYSNQMDHMKISVFCVFLTNKLNDMKIGRPANEESL